MKKDKKEETGLKKARAKKQMKRDKTPASSNETMGGKYLKLPDKEMENVDWGAGQQELFRAIKENLPKLEELLNQYSSHWRYEDPVYRFYHHSSKVLRLRDAITEIVDALKSLMPSYELNKMFMEIFEEGTAIKSIRVYKTDPPGVSLGDINANWTKYTRPIVEAFFHARYFLEMTVKYGKELKYPPLCMPSGWAAVLYLYNLRSGF